MRWHWNSVKISNVHSWLQRNLFRGRWYAPHHKPAAQPFQYLFLIKSHGLSSPLLYVSLLQLFAGVHHPGGSDLTSPNLVKKTINKHGALIFISQYQSVTSPNPPFPRTLYCLNPCLVMGCLEEKDDAQLQIQHLWAGLWLTVKVETKMLADLSTIFHCRNRSKYMLLWYWLKGSPLRYLWSTLVQDKECHWLLVTHTHTHKHTCGENRLTYSLQAWKTSEQGSTSRLWLQLWSWLSRVDTHWLDWESSD